MNAMTSNGSAISWLRGFSERQVARIRQSWRNLLALALILAAAAALRLYGLNWDGGQWLHPDERRIYFVVLGLDWPHSLAEALSPSSPLNPGFFAYGSLPFYLLKLAVTLLQPVFPALGDPGNLHLLGRPLAALFDLGTIYLTYRLATILLPAYHSRWGLRWGALLSAGLMSVAVLPVQLAHFYTVDPLLAFNVMLTLNLAADVARGAGRLRQVALGVALGLALATKVSAAPLVFALFVAFYIQTQPDGSESPISRALSALRRMILPLLVAGVTFFVTQPYALIDWQTFLNDTLSEAQIARGTLDVPYTIQYAGTLPFLYQMWQTAFWGLALPLGLAAWAGLAASLIRWLRRGAWTDALLLAWAGPYLAVTGLLYAKYLRYMLPLVPILCLLAADLLMRIGRHGDAVNDQRPASVRRLRSAVLMLVILASSAYALTYASIYAAPHSWVTASEWIYRNVPAGSTLAVEHWDTALPLSVEVDGQIASPTVYDYRTLALYDEPDNAAKWTVLAQDLAESDYVVIASRRLYGSIPREPDRYPLATHYYDLLFAGNLGFEPAGEFTRGPAFLNPRIAPLPGAAPALLRPDESFVVYDHPRALIFRNAEHLGAEELLRRLDVGEPLGPSPLQ
jgi:4-amino-4-deoxy-L-arabinose transferase-like glycosyltransferase